MISTLQLQAFPFHDDERHFLPNNNFAIQGTFVKLPKHHDLKDQDEIRPIEPGIGARQ